MKIPTKSSGSKEPFLSKRPPSCCITWSKNEKFSNWRSLGFTPLHIAVVTRAPRFSLYCLAKSGLANIKSKDGFTALQLAAILTPDYDTIQTLIKGGAYTNIMDDFHRTALDLAAYLNHREAVVAILESSQKWVFENFKEGDLKISFDRLLVKSSLVFCRPYDLKEEFEWPFPIQYEGTYNDKSPRRIFSLIGQAHTALHYAIASPMLGICLQCLPEWKLRDHEHAYTIEDTADAEEEHKRRLEAHTDDFVERLVESMLIVAPIPGPNGLSVLKYGTWSIGRKIFLDLKDAPLEAREYTSWFVSLPDLDGKTAMDYALFRNDLRAEDQIKLINQLKSWGGVITEECRQSVGNSKDQVDAKLKGFEINSKVYEDIMKNGTQGWRKTLTFRNKISEEQSDDTLPLPKRSPMEATKELIEDAANHGLHAAILRSRNASAKPKAPKSIEQEDKGKNTSHFEVSTITLT